MTKFEELGIDKNILKAIKELGFENPMPVQEKVIPHLLSESNEDLIALAQTGTGKTAAFGIPLIQNTDFSKKKTQHLVLCPTRELCVQISNDLTNYSKYTDGLRVVAVFGGASIENQIKSIKKGAHIISATPGRLLDLLNRTVINIKEIKTIVLDEADEMLNMGFRDDLEAILSETSKEKNTLLFSATMPSEVRQIANRYMKDPIEITIGKKNSGSDSVNHICYMVHERDRYLALKRIVDFFPEVYGIVFCRTRIETKQIADKLMQDGYNADALHGDLSQQQRDAVMNKFRIKNIKLLVATDVAARGLDVDNLSHIINYNLPEDLEVYTHRSGRTGRAGRLGTSIVVANLKEKQKIKLIEKQINKKFEHLAVPSGKEICEKQLFYLIDRMQNVEVVTSEIDSYLPTIYAKLSHLDKEELIKKFVSVEFNRFLDYYKNAPDLSKPDDTRRSSDSRSSRNVEGFTRFFVNLGKKDDLKPASLMGIINDFTGIRDIEIGDIEILKSFSFFEADSSFSEKILKSFAKKEYKGRKVNLEIAENKKSTSSRSKSKDREKEGFRNSRKSFGSSRRNDSKPRNRRR